MNSLQTEQIRLSALRYCANATAIGMSAPLILQCLRAEGHHLDAAELDRQIRYLIGKNLLASAEKQISPENPSYNVTATGEDFIAINMAS